MSGLERERGPVAQGGRNRKGKTPGAIMFPGFEKEALAFPVIGSEGGNDRGGRDDIQEIREKVSLQARGKKKKRCDCEPKEVRGRERGWGKV